MTFRVEDFRKTTTCTITTGDSTSGAVDLGGYRLAAIVNPSSWTTASLTFTAATSSDATFYPVYGTTGNEITVTTTGTNIHVLDSDTSLALSACRWLKLESGVHGTLVTQSSEVTFTLVLA